MTRTDLPEYPFHEIAELFPLMVGKEFDEFKRDIHENGQQEPIWLYQGRIIDGRNRYRACRDLGRPVLRREWDGNGSLVAFVQSLNLRRRHLDEAQRAMVGAKIKRRFEEEAKGRQVEQTRGNQPKTTPANLREEKTHSNPAIEHAAREMNVSPRSVEAASKVLRDGVPDLVKAVERGEVAVSAAAEVATLPKPVQRAVVQAGTTAIVRHAAESRQQRKAERVEVRKPQQPKQKSAPEEDEIQAADLYIKWSKTVSDLRLRLTSIDEDQLRSLITILKPEDREAATDDLKELASMLARWIKLLENSNA